MARSALALTVLLLAPGILWGQTDSAGPGVRFRFPGSLQGIRIPAAHRLAAAALRPDPAGLAARWAGDLHQSLDSIQRGESQAGLMRRLYGQSTDAGARRGALGLGKEFVDLAIDGSLGVELRSDRLRNERCTPYELQDPASGCRGKFTAPRIDNDLVLKAGGLVGQRLHINVDFDNKRDFNANNDIRVFYQGLEDEVVQRVEVGTVTFTPPPSRFITAAIPAYSFGINSRFQVGPVTLGALAASQKGSAVTTRTYVVGATTSQPQDRVLRDLDLEQGRFYWVVDPLKVAGYPAVDILNVTGTSVDESVRPVELRLYRYRPSQGGGVTPGLGGITAFGYRDDSQQRTGTVPWQLLVQGQDYILDPSGLWVALTNRLDAGDYLAVSYRTAAGQVIGSFPSRDNPAANDSLLLVVEPRRGADVPTFRYEMRQIYRLAGTDLDKNSLQVDLTLNQSQRPASGASTYLAQLGLAIPTDPDRIDINNRVFPRARDQLATQALRESYIVFPNLRPFADPGHLTPTERNDSLYQTPAYLLLTQGPPAHFQFHLKYNAAGGGDRNFIDLNAFQIRPGSEKIIVNGRQLVPDVEYSISYELGRVTFVDPDALFGNGQATVTAQFEERGIFAVAPTTIYGLTGTYRVGQMGSLNLIGIYQRENTVFTRPPVGFEPTGNLVGGVTGDFHFRPRWATDLMNSVVVGGTAAPSTLDLQGEYAFTAPQANRAGQAYLEEFEAEGGVPVSLRENAWGFGSRPDHPDGVESIGFAAGFDSADAVQMTWQNLVPGPGGQPVEIRTQDIDSLIRITGGAAPIETVMYMTLHADTAGGFVRPNSTSAWSLPRRNFKPRWRSMVTPLSVSGTDLSQSEYLEFWVFEGASATADAAGVRMVIDLGTVGEDALAIAPESLTVTGTDSVWTGRRYAGVGRLDTEREPTGYFNAATDDNGILVDRPDTLIVNGVPVTDAATCGQTLSGIVALYPWGDLSERCTRGNGTLDTEDLNGDNVLDAGGHGDNVLRYVVPLGDPRYFVRKGGTGWKLYRVPLRQPDATIGSPNIHLVQHLRLTLAAPPDGGTPDIVARFAVARMRFLGSTWVRRSDTPVLGLSGATAQPHGEVVVTTISTDNRELGYVPPPGVLDQAARADAARGLQVNERSLRIIGSDLQPDERAEGYFRFIAGPQNLLKYRSLRFWVRGRGPGWSDGRLEAVFKVGSDARNFYAYRTPASTDTWDPEVNVDLDIWRQLRAQIETRWLSGQAPSGASACGGGDSTAYVACQGHYLVQVATPGINPPNLAAVQEIDAAVHYVGTGAALTDAELWVDDIRLVDPINTVGTASALTARLTAADVADLSLSFVRQDGNFQQIGQDPTYRTTTTEQVGGNVRLDRFLPQSLGIAMPASVSFTHSNVDPILVTGTDLRASDLIGLRKPSATQVAMGFSVRRRDRGHTWATRGFVDPLSFNGNLTSGSSQTELSDGTSASYALAGGYDLVLPRRGPRLPFEGLVAGLPAWLRKSPLGEGLKHPVFALAPTAIRLHTGLDRNEFSFTTYQVAIQRASDSLNHPSLNLSSSWRNSAGLTFQPLGMLTLDGNLSSTRDLRHYDDTTSLGRLAAAARHDLLGLDVGVERDRQMSTSLALTPRVATWLRPRYLRNSSFSLFRSLTSRDPVRIGPDSGAFLLPQTYNNVQGNEVGASVDLNRVAVIVGGDSGWASHFFKRVRPLDASLRKTRGSSFDLATFDPGLSYMFATGGRADFLAQHGALANYATEGSEARLAGGADLPGGFNLTLNRSNIVTRTFSNIGGNFVQNESRQTAWPSGSARWNAVLRRGPVALLIVGTSFQQREGVVITPSSAGAARSRTLSGQVAPDMTIGLRNGLTATFNFSRLRQIQENSANRTENTTDQLSGTVSQSIRLPASISVTRKPVRASMYGQSITTQTCLFVASSAAQGCKLVADIRRLVVNGGVTSEVLPMAEAGLNLQYVSNEIRNLNQRTTQLSIVATLRVQLTSGALR